MRPGRSLFVITCLCLIAARAEAVDLILLDNTSNLSTANLTNSSQTTWGSNTPAYNRINGYTFQVGATSYDATAVSLPIRYSGGGSVSPTIRIQLWELPNLSATTPAGGAVPFYIQDVSSNSFDLTYQYFTLPFTNGTLNLKANTRYSIGFLTDLTTNSTSLAWNGYNPLGAKPSGSFGLASLSGGSGFFSTNGGTSFSASSMNFGFQLTGVAVPEPSTYALTGMSILALALSGRKFRNRA